MTTPILFFSAVPKELVAVAIPSAHGTFYLAKPFKKIDLLTAVAHILAGQADEKLQLAPSESLAPTDAAAVPPAPVAAIAANPAKGVILVIEDDKDTCALIKLALEKVKYTIGEVHDGAEAMRYFGLSASQQTPVFTKPDLIILNAMLPQIDGYTLNQHFLESPATRSIPVMIVTDKREMRDLFSDSPNVIRFIDKPVNAQQLQKQVASILGASKAP